MFLTPLEISQLTGRKRRSSQAEALRCMGIEHKERPDGSLVVLRSHVQHLLGGGGDAKITAEVQPNWGALATSP